MNGLSTLKKVIKRILPPILLDAYSKLFTAQQNNFSGIFEKFEEVPDEDVWDSPYWLSISKRKLDLLSHKTRLSPADYASLLLLIVNQISRTRKCSVLDFGGGTGFVFHVVKKRFTNPANVDWFVLDSESIMNIGREYMAQDDRIHFVEEMPSKVDIVYMNTVLQRKY